MEFQYGFFHEKNKEPINCLIGLTVWKYYVQNIYKVIIWCGKTAISSKKTKKMKKNKAILTPGTAECCSSKKIKSKYSTQPKSEQYSYSHKKAQNRNF